jgi:hypothetical protein
METLNKVDYAYLLQQSLSDLHLESVNWISEIQFLKTEYAYFEKVLKKYSDPGQPRQFEITLEDLSRKLVSLKREVITEFGTELNNHELYLRDLLESKPGYDDTTYRDKHLSVADKMKALKLKHRTFKKELMDFVIEIM